MQDRMLPLTEADEKALPRPLGDRFYRHARRPVNMGRLTRPNGRARGVGTCGDAIEIELLVRNQRIHEIGLIPEGCLYTVACASALGELVKGQHLGAALEITPEDVSRELGGLPEDHRHCAALAVNTLGEAIDDHYQKIWGRGHVGDNRSVHSPDDPTKAA